MSMVRIYKTSTFILEEYPDGVCVLLRDGELPFYADHIRWFDNWGDDIDLSLMAPTLVARPDLPTQALTAPGGLIVSPVFFHGKGTDLDYRWGFAIENMLGALSLTNLFGEILYPAVQTAYCLSESPDNWSLAETYKLRRTYPPLVPPYVIRALEDMVWYPLTAGIAKPTQLLTYQL